VLLNFSGPNKISNRETIIVLTIILLMSWIGCQKTVNIFGNTSILDHDTRSILFSIPPSIENIIERVRSANNNNVG